ncbi:UBX domain-containing protein 1-like isoform X2 [Acipenser ruthenus]|uniref:UBX domain-containing protein 1-like isoform X2 n=1 Tax=Acipenser ruthenus TaxID=7906 RepID=UPI0027408941|nr:UBX domain-containing protein 1-like isoform X2 [Acipenser ruthenus]
MLGRDVIGRTVPCENVPARLPYCSRTLPATVELKPGLSNNGDVTMAEFTALDSLMEMGFSKNRAERALAHTGNQGIERAMDWIMAHESDPDIDEPYVPPAGHVLGSDPTQLTLTPPPAPPTDPAAVAAEGSQEEQSKRPLTEEEKQEQIKRLEELMRVKQQEREEREKQEEVERERERRRHGQELLQVKQRLQEEEMKKLAEERKREKIEEKQARQRVRDKIERDKAERAMKFGGGCSRAAPVTPPVEAPPTSPPASQGPPPAKREYDECRIQVRLLDGSALTSAFKAREPLAAVRLYVELNRTDGAEEFTLLTPFPRRQFTEEDMETPLQELGLVPSAVLMVAKK